MESGVPSKNDSVPKGTRKPHAYAERSCDKTGRTQPLPLSRKVIAAAIRSQLPQNTAAHRFSRGHRYRSAGWLPLSRALDSPRRGGLTKLVAHLAGHPYRSTASCPSHPSTARTRDRIV